MTPPSLRCSERVHGVLTNLEPYVAICTRKLEVQVDYCDEGRVKITRYRCPFHGAVWPFDGDATPYYDLPENAGK